MIKKLKATGFVMYVIGLFVLFAIYPPAIGLVLLLALIASVIGYILLLRKYHKLESELQELRREV